MTWTPGEWDAFCSLLEHGFKDEFPHEAAVAYRVLLDGLTLDDLTVALREMIAEGRTWRPSAGELVAAARRDPAAPTFDEAYQLLYGPRGVLVGRGSDAEVWQRLGELHPHLSAFVRRQGLNRLRLLELDDPDYGGARRAELRKSWESFTETTRARERRAIAIGAGAEGLRRLDPLAHLDGPVIRRLEPATGEATAA